MVEYQRPVRREGGGLFKLYVVQLLVPACFELGCCGFGLLAGRETGDLVAVAVVVLAEEEPRGAFVRVRVGVLRVGGIHVVECVGLDAAEEFEAGGSAAGGELDHFVGRDAVDAEGVLGEDLGQSLGSERARGEEYATGPGNPAAGGEEDSCGLLCGHPFEVFGGVCVDLVDRCGVGQADHEHGFILSGGGRVSVSTALKMMVGGVLTALLEHHAHAWAHRRPPGVRVAAQDPHGSAARPVQSLDQFQGRGLARTVGAQQREQLTPLWVDPVTGTTKTTHVFLMCFSLASR